MLPANDIAAARANLFASDRLRRYFETLPDEIWSRVCGAPDFEAVAFFKPIIMPDELRCGQVAVGLGDPGGCPTEPDVPLELAAEHRRVESALRLADLMAPYSGWTAPAPPSKALQLRFREIMPSCRWAFDSQGKALASREKVRATLFSYRQTCVRGAGSIAHLTPAAVAAFSGARTRRDLSDWTDALGRELERPRAKPAQRELGRNIAFQAVILETRACALFRAAFRRT